MDGELVMVQRITQFGGDTTTGADRLVHFLLVKAKVRRDARFRPVHGEIGIVDQRRNLFGVLRPQRDTHAHAAAQRRAVIFDGHGDRGPQAIDQVDRILVTVDADQRDEFVAAQAGEELAGPRQCLHPHADRRQ